MEEKDYTVFVNNNCPGCLVVTQYVKEHGIGCEIVNIDFDKTQPPDNLLVFPALFKSEDRLLAYGEDIIRYFQKHLSNSIR